MKYLRLAKLWRKQAAARGQSRVNVVFKLVINLWFTNTHTLLIK